MVQFLVIAVTLVDATTPTPYCFIPPIWSPKTSAFDVFWRLDLPARWQWWLGLDERLLIHVAAGAEGWRKLGAKSWRMPSWRPAWHVRGTKCFPWLLCLRPSEGYCRTGRATRRQNCSIKAKRVVLIYFYLQNTEQCRLFLYPTSEMWKTKPLRK